MGCLGVWSEFAGSVIQHHVASVSLAKTKGLHSPVYILTQPHHQCPLPRFAYMRPQLYWVFFLFHPSYSFWVGSKHTKLDTSIEMEEEAEEIATEVIVFLGPVCGHSGKWFLTTTGNQDHCGWPKVYPLTWLSPFCEMLLLPYEEDQTARFYITQHWQAVWPWTSHSTSVVVCKKNIYEDRYVD